MLNIDRAEVYPMMVSGLRWLIFPTVMAFSLDAAAILLDCEDLGNGTYTCVEIKDPYYLPPPATESAPDADPVAASGNPYIEEARNHCTYRKPRGRKGGGGAMGSAKMEALKKAQKDYDRCIVEKAWELKKAAEKPKE